MHGEVCPANWTQGSKTIKTDPIAKLEYFSIATNGHSNGATNGHSNGATNGSPKKRLRAD